MTIRINLDIMMAKRKMRLKTLAKEVGITEANLSVLKNGKAKAVRLSTLDKLCEVLECQPGDILEFERRELLAQQNVAQAIGENGVDIRVSGRVGFSQTDPTQSPLRKIQIKYTPADPNEQALLNSARKSNGPVQ